MRFLFRWVAEALAFYLALYLVDSVIAPRFYVGAVWIAAVLAVFMGLLNSLIRPLHLIRKKPVYALIVTALTVAINTLILMIAVWAGAPLSTTSVLWVVVTAAFLSLLAGVLNWLIGFKAKERASVISRPRPARTDKGGRHAKRGHRAKRTAT